MRASHLLLVLIALATHPAWSQKTGHYPQGAEGIKAASIPGPGRYLKWYNFYYEADRLKDRGGNTLPVGLDVDAFITAPRYIAITEHKFLGADYGWDILVPLLSQDVSINAIGNSHTAVGDIYIEPILLGWHGECYDALFAAGLWAPTGNHDLGNPANAGKDFWTGMFTVGGTLYLDCDKTWSASAMARYETHTEQSEIAIRPGDDFHIEWGISKNLCQAWEVGVSGYTQWQLTDDAGAAVNYDASVHDETFFIGPEVQYAHQDTGLFFALRYHFEFGTRDRPQGRNLVFSITKVLGPGGGGCRHAHGCCCGE